MRKSPPKDQKAWPPSEASGSWSTRTTRLPASASSAVATRPASPAPTTTTSVCCSGVLTTPTLAGGPRPRAVPPASDAPVLRRTTRGPAAAARARGVTSGPTSSRTGGPHRAARRRARPAGATSPASSQAAAGRPRAARTHPAAAPALQHQHRADRPPAPASTSGMTRNRSTAGSGSQTSQPRYRISAVRADRRRRRTGRRAGARGGRHGVRAARCRAGRTSHRNPGARRGRRHAAQRRTSAWQSVHARRVGARAGAPVEDRRHEACSPA